MNSAGDAVDILTRAKALDLGGNYDIPPGDPISHFGAGLAKILCSNVFLAGLDPTFVAEHNDYFTAPFSDHGILILREIRFDRISRVRCSADVKWV